MKLKTIVTMTMVGLARTTFSGTFTSHLAQESISGAVEDRRAFNDYVHEFEKSYSSKEEFK